MSQENVQAVQMPARMDASVITALAESKNAARTKTAANLAIVPSAQMLARMDAYAMTVPVKSRTAAKEVPAALKANARIAQMLAKTAVDATTVSAAKMDHQRCSISEQESLLWLPVPPLTS